MPKDKQKQHNEEKQEVNVEEKGLKVRKELEAQIESLISDSTNTIERFEKTRRGVYYDSTLNDFINQQSKKVTNLRSLFYAMKKTLKSGNTNKFLNSYNIAQLFIYENLDNTAELIGENNKTYRDLVLNNDSLMDLVKRVAETDYVMKSMNNHTKNYLDNGYISVPIENRKRANEDFIEKSNNEVDKKVEEQKIAKETKELNVKALRDSAVELNKKATDNDKNYSKKASELIRTKEYTKMRNIASVFSNLSFFYLSIKSIADYIDIQKVDNEKALASLYLYENMDKKADLIGEPDLTYREYLFREGGNVWADEIIEKLSNTNFIKDSLNGAEEKLFTNGYIFTSNEERARLSDQFFNEFEEKYVQKEEAKVEEPKEVQEEVKQEEVPKKEDNEQAINEEVQNEEVTADEKAEYINKIVNMESAQSFIFGKGYENKENKDKYVSNPVNDLKGNHANNYKEKVFKNEFKNIKSDAEKALGEDVFDKYNIQPSDIYNKLQEIQQAYLDNNPELKTEYDKNLEIIQREKEKIHKKPAEKQQKELEAKQNPVVEGNPIVQPVQNNPIQENNLEDNKQEVIQEKKPEIINPNKVIAEQEFKEIEEKYLKDDILVEQPQKVIPNNEPIKQPVKELSADQIKAFKDELIRLVDRINKSHSSKQENSDAYKKLKANLSNFKEAHKNDAMTAADFKAKLAGFEKDANEYLKEHALDENNKYKTCGKSRQERIKTCARIKAMNALLNKGIPYDSHSGKIVMLASKIVCAEAINKGYDGFTELCGDKAIENAIQNKLNDKVFLKKAGFIAKNKKAYDKLVKMSGSDCLELFNKQPAEAKKAEEAKDNVQKQDNEAEFNSMFR